MTMMVNNNVYEKLQAGYNDCTRLLNALGVESTEEALNRIEQLEKALHDGKEAVDTILSALGATDAVSAVENFVALTKSAEALVDKATKHAEDCIEKANQYSELISAKSKILTALALSGDEIDKSELNEDPAVSEIKRLKRTERAYDVLCTERDCLLEDDRRQTKRAEDAEKKIYSLENQVSYQRLTIRALAEKSCCHNCAGPLNEDGECVECRERDLEFEKTKEQLDIALKTLKIYGDTKNWSYSPEGAKSEWHGEWSDGYEEADFALSEIEALGSAIEEPSGEILLLKAQLAIDAPLARAADAYEVSRHAYYGSFVAGNDDLNAVGILDDASRAAYRVFRERLVEWRESVVNGGAGERAV